MDLFSRVRQNLALIETYFFLSFLPMFFFLSVFLTYYLFFFPFYILSFFLAIKEKSGYV